MSNLREKTISSETKYTGYIFNVRRDEVLLSDGKKHFREVVEHPGGVVIVPIAEDNKIIFVKQWRYPVDQDLIELPAGKLNKDAKNPLLEAKRELREETGFVAKNWESLGFVYSTPGFCNEKLYFYKAYDLVFEQTELDYGEIVKTVIIDINQVWCMIKEGKIIDAKSIIGLSMI